MLAGTKEGDMAYRPYPDRDRALKQLARKERITGRRWTTETGSIAEEYDFPGQSLGALTARMTAAFRRAQPSGDDLITAIGAYRLSTRGPVVGGQS